MSGNFWCFGCTNYINKNKPFIIIKCSDDECGNHDYFCDNECIEICFLENIDMTKCNSCESNIIKEYLNITPSV